MKPLLILALGLAAGAALARRPALKKLPSRSGPVRAAGPTEMRDPPPHWSREDELSDESFPASDPPGTY